MKTLPKWIRISIVVLAIQLIGSAGAFSAEPEPFSSRTIRLNDTTVVDFQTFERETTAEEMKKEFLVDEPKKRMIYTIARLKSADKVQELGMVSCAYYPAGHAELAKQQMKKPVFDAKLIDDQLYVLLKCREWTCLVRLDNRADETIVRVPRPPTDVASDNIGSGANPTPRDPAGPLREGTVSEARILAIKDHREVHTEIIAATGRHVRNTPIKSPFEKGK